MSELCMYPYPIPRL